MSSLRNAVARRPHKERSQPTARSKWGLLEKHKDYSLRAADYNKKQAKLRVLEQKSREKHPDEFAFGMLSSGSARQGKHGQRGEENRLSHDAVQLLKTQDAGYLRMQAQRTRREVEKVQEEVGVDEVFRGKGRSSTGKVLFDEHETAEPTPKRRRVEGAHEDDLNGDSEDNFEDAHDQPMEETRTVTTKISPKVYSKKQLQKEKDQLTQLKADRKRRKRLQELRTAKLEVLKKRQKDIMAAAEQLDLQRAKMAKSIGGTNKNGVKFKIRERKR